jgi:cell division GTPase FtsZ
MTKKERTINELRQVKDSVYDYPNNKTLTEVEQNLMNELNYKATLILKIEDMLKEKNVPIHSKSLYAFSIEELESVWTLWTVND